MARPRRIDLELVSKARAVVAQASNVSELRAAQAVLLPALANTTLEQTAELLGVGRDCSSGSAKHAKWPLPAEVGVAAGGR